MQICVAVIIWLLAPVATSNNNNNDDDNNNNNDRNGTKETHLNGALN